MHFKNNSVIDFNPIFIDSSMVRTYKKKRSKPDVQEDDMQAAISAVREQNLSIRKAAAIYGLTHTALFYRLKNKHDSEKKYVSKYTAKQVFTVQQEAMLKTYILQSSKINYGLTYVEIRKLAFSYAKLLECNYPSNWDKSNMAGIDWLQGYMKRHDQLALRKPENTSLARATSFNKTNVTEFQDNYERALQLYPFTAEKIYNLDETGITTVVQAPHVVAKKGAKQVGQAVSAERGQLVTMCAIVNACGNSVPPVFVYPRARFHDNMLKGAPPGSLGLPNSPTSGWMTGPLFVRVLEHIQKYTKCSKDDPILILMDNHESHCTLEAVIYARDHGMILVTFPPHCTHRLQPLDVAVMGPFKGKLSVAQNDWLTSNPGKTLTIHDLAGLANIAYSTAFSIKNITSGFSKPGIWLFSRNAFTDEDFEAAFVTDREAPGEGTENHASAESTANVEAVADSSTSNVREPSSSTSQDTVRQTGQVESTLQIQTPKHTPKVDAILSPEMVRPFPKAGPRSTTVRKCKKKKSRILTETPEKNRIEEETLNRLAKKRKVPLNLEGKQKKEKSPEVTVKKQKKLLENSSDSSTEGEDNYSIHDNSDTLDLEEGYEEAEINPVNLVEGDYVVIKFATKKLVRHFVAQIENRINTDENEYKVQYLKRRLTKNEKAFKFFCQMTLKPATLLVKISS